MISSKSIQLTAEEKSIIHTYPFAQIIASPLDSSPFAELANCPLLLIEDNCFLGHLSAHNPLIRSAKENNQINVIFNGPHGYISPRWHSEQKVPTWNYANVTLACYLTIIENDCDKLQAMRKISHHFDPQWDFNEFSKKSNAVMVKRMLEAITVFTLDIIDIKSKFKLSQNRSVDCRASFQKHLRLVDNHALADMQLF